MTKAKKTKAGKALWERDSAEHREDSIPDDFDSHLRRKTFTDLLTKHLNQIDDSEMILPADPSMRKWMSAQKRRAWDRAYADYWDLFGEG